MSSIETIAEKTGYHKSTISRVLSGYKWINPDTREKVLKIAKELNYKPNFLAKALASKKTHVIGLINPLMNGFSYFPELCEGVEAAAKAKNYRVLTYNSTEKTEKIIEMIKLFVDHQVDGIISFYPYPTEASDIDYLEHIRESGIQYVSCSPTGKGDQVIWNIEKGISLAMDYLFRNGHKHIAFIGGINSATSYEKDKFKAYKQKLLEHGVKYDKKLYVSTDGSVRGGYDALLKLLKYKEKFTALLTSRDMIAIGAMKAIRISGLKIPDDIAVVGFDNLTALLPFAEVPLTSVEPAKFELGHKACELLIKKIEGKTKKASQIISVAPRLIVRASSKNKIDESSKGGKDMKKTGQ